VLVIRCLPACPRSGVVLVRLPDAVNTRDASELMLHLNRPAAEKIGGRVRCKYGTAQGDRSIDVRESTSERIS
jgi:hypothetical protein